MQARAMLLNRRGLLAGAGSAAILAGCAAPFPDDRAEELYPPIGELIPAGDEIVHVWRASPEGAGAERTPVVLIHGASGNLRDFTFALAPFLAAERPVIAVDRPGFGYSTRPATGAEDPREQARIIRSATEGLGIERPIVLGHSYGAAVAMGWAVTAPETLSGVVAVSGVTMPYRGAGRFLSAIGLTSLITWAYTEYLKSIADEGGVESFLSRVFRPQRVPDGYAEYVGAPLSLRDGTLRANGKDLERVNSVLIEMSPEYGKLDLPVEIVHGEADFIDAAKQGVALDAVLQRSRLTLLPKVGHMAHHVAPAVLAAACSRIEGTLES
ncbi:MAG: alpha/beta hydrolase [Pseudomonadota bacterium]